MSACRLSGAGDGNHRYRTQKPPVQLSPGPGPGHCTVHPLPSDPRCLNMNKVEPLDQSIGTNSTELPNFETDDHEDENNDEEKSPTIRNEEQSLEQSQNMRQSTAEMRSDVVKADPMQSIQSYHSETVNNDVNEEDETEHGHTVITVGDSHEDCNDGQMNGHAPVAVAGPAPDTDTEIW